ncbi:MAG TPA: hypothetical protein PL110_01640 [Candidatus Eremiobacteraeota bacterium]|nr:hypothetical protein [Candidatus Eremiobacteraeota bacterium]
MGFSEEVKTLAERLVNLRDKLPTTEAIKYSLVMPFLKCLGYDIFDPGEFIPSYPLEKDIIDYVILRKEEPEIIIEVKGLKETLDTYRQEVSRHFTTIGKARLAILTNGITYHVFTDLDEANKLDEKPVITIDLANLKEESIKELEKFKKELYNIENILQESKNLKYTIKTKEYLQKQLETPENDFILFVLRSICLGGELSGEEIDRYGATVKKAIIHFKDDFIIKKPEEVKEEVKEEEKPVEPVAEEKPVEPVAEEKPVEPVAEEKPKEEVKEEKEEEKAKEDGEEEKKRKKRGLFW